MGIARIIPVTAALVALAPGHALASRCGDRLVSVGLSAAEVRAKCGAPLLVEQTMDTRTIRDYENRGGYIERRLTLPVERWTYAPGPNRLLTSLVFENGRLIRIDTEGRMPPQPGNHEQCRNLVTNLGDSTAEVLLRCGPPTDAYQWIEERVFGRSTAGAKTGHGVVVVHDRWLYNFGPRHFLRILKFENGRLVSKATGSYGF